MAASADERVDADQRRDLRLIVDQRVGVERRDLVAELLVQMLSSGLSPDSRLARSCWRCVSQAVANEISPPIADPANATTVGR
jgi:hypothetical protein